MEALKEFILDRLDQYSPRLENARAMYKKLPKNSVEQESWAGRIQELYGRMEELELIYKKIDRYVR